MSLTVNTKSLKEAFKKFTFESRQQMAKTLREQGRGLAMELAQKTPPATYSDGESVLKNGAKRVDSEIRRVYKSVPVVAKIISESNGRSGRTKTQNMRQAAKVFAGLAKGVAAARGRSARSAGRRFAAAQTATHFLENLNVKPMIYTTVGPFDGGTAHNKARFGKYRRVPKNQYVRLVPTTDPRKIDQYVKRKVAHIGMAKSGWVQAARALGGDHAFRSKSTVSLPKWVKRHTRASGRAIDKSQDPKNPYISVTNTVPWIADILSKGEVNETLFYRRKALMTRLGYILRKAAKETGF